MTMTIVIENQSCSQCRYWQNIPGSDVGKCRRYPPQMVVVQESVSPKSIGVKGVLLGEKGAVVTTIRGEYPVLSNRDPGCGEFKERESETTNAD